MSTDPQTVPGAHPAMQGVWLVAHDLKNSFSLLSNVFEELQQHLVADESSRRAFTESRWLLSHVDMLATALLDGIRYPALERSAVFINEFLLEREAMLNRALSPGVSLALRPSAQPLRVLATVPELERLLFALVSNACQAMPNGGDLTITAGWLDHVAGTTCAEVRPRRYVRLTVSDTGAGLDRDAHMSLLETFPDDGAAMETARENVISAVRRLHGWVIVESEERAGTRVHVCLPVLPDLD
jgi:signal transduction histidine kinase